jgi:hypothetical protein
MQVENNDINKLLRDRFGILLPDALSLRRMSEKKIREWLERGDRVTYLYSQDFLTTQDDKNPFTINPGLIKLVADIIRKKGLKIYFGMLSYHGRKDSALFTGLHVFQSMESYRESWRLTYFMGYQGARETALCRKLREMGANIYLNDQVQLEDREKNAVVSYNEPGKAANCVKTLKMIEQEVMKEQRNPQKTFVIIVDDDYIMQDSLTFLMMIIPWVLSFTTPQITDDKHLHRLIEKCQKVGFVKSGSPRLQFSRRVMREIVYGEKQVMSYREFLIELLKREIRELGERFEREDRKAAVEKMVKEFSHMKTAIRQLEKMPPAVVMTPENFPDVLSTFEKSTGRSSNVIKKYLQRKVRLGGRVTSLLTTLLLHYSEDPLPLWLSKFTYLLHGDQGAPLSHWLNMSLGRGYAIEISLLVQFLLDRRFQNLKVINAISNPHIHQSQQDVNVDRMRDAILSSLDLFRLLYGEMKPLEFLQRYDIGETGRKRILRYPDGRIDFDEHLLHLEENPLIPQLKGLILAEDPTKRNRQKIA